MSNATRRVVAAACAFLVALSTHAHPDEMPDSDAVRGAGAEASPLLIMPVSGATLSSRFGPRIHPILGITRTHEGVDWSAPHGAAIQVVADGVVISTGWEGDYGYTTRIRHAPGVETVYAHQSRIASGLSVGDLVEQGQTIGAVGSTGLATGPHLHFEILVNGRPIDPLGEDLQRIGERFQVARLR